MARSRHSNIKQTALLRVRIRVKGRKQSLQNCFICPRVWKAWSSLCQTHQNNVIRFQPLRSMIATMKTSDVTDTLNMALVASGCDQANVVHKPRLLSDNGASYISGELADYIKDNKMSHVRGAPYHPQTQGKIERWHQTLKNRILLENYFLPGDLERQIESFIEHYNHHRYHESLNNVTPADVYFGQAQSIINKRERIKHKTIEHRRLQYRKAVA